ncbi:hypothetical protein SAMN04244572_00609 [Azotobacter beijerinckii]|uniref:Uncharacterized protein n=1 Tax=Azotobacter beijerinckii TaxID=170623 RepID=A0A1H6RC00_9GAMM|nr:hypothetical protein SAMN04244579_00237 [Azotobacter beijerinckii]SEI50764.1 hypothetical protein SAMN04244572_00609 [Azotobacter beijerinckii]
MKGIQGSWHRRVQDRPGEEALWEEGLEAALARKRPERDYARKADGALEARLIAMNCSPPLAQAFPSIRQKASQILIHISHKFIVACLN